MKRVPACLLFLTAMVGVFAGGPDRPDPAQTWYGRALDCFQRKDFETGVKSYYKFHLYSDSFLSATYCRKDLQPAREFFSQALTRKPDDRKAELFLTLVDRLGGDLEGAWDRLRKLFERHPTMPMLLLLRQEFALARQENDVASDSFARLHKLGVKTYLRVARGLVKKYQLEDPDPERVKNFLLTLAIKHWTAFENDASERLYRRFIERFPEDPRGPELLAELLVERGKGEEAWKVIQAWESKGGKTLLGHLARGRLLSSLKNFREALKELEIAAREDSQNLLIVSFLAEAAWQVEDFQRALPEFQRLYESDPANTGYFMRMASCLEATGQADALLELFRTLLKGDPEDVFLRCECANLLFRMGEKAKAAETFNWLAGFENPYQEYAKQMLEYIGPLPAPVDAPAVASAPPPVETLDRAGSETPQLSLDEFIEQRMEAMADGS